MNDLRKWAYEQKGIIISLILLAILLGFVIVVQAYYLVMTVDAVFLQNASFQSVISMLLVVFCLMLIRVGTSYTSAYLGVKFSALIKEKIRGLLLKKWTSNPIQASIQGQSGSKMTIMLEAVDGIESYYKDYLPQVLKASIVPLIIVIVVTYTHFYSGLIMMLTAPLIPFFYIIIGIKTKKKSDEQLEKLSAFSGQFLDTLQGLQTLKLFGRSEEQRNKIEKSSRGFRNATMAILKVAFTSTFMLELISTLSMGLIALELGFRLVVFDSISFATAFFIFVLAPEYYNALKELGSAFHTGRGSISAANKIKEELDIQSQFVKWGAEEISSNPTIELKQVGYQYGKGFRLADVNLVIPANSRIAIIGPTGHGKTTLLNLLSGLIEPIEGAILLNGLPRCHFTEESWFDKVSYIPQQPYLFSGTLEDNIRLGSNQEHSSEDLEKAIKRAGLTTWIQTLENGIKTKVGEAGRGLSGGEKHRVALARAFLKEPSIVFLDEPTFGLDLKTEQILQHAIDELAKSSTIVIVAHRLQTIRDADSIYLIEKGHIKASGTHKELMDSSSTYRAMVQGGAVNEKAN